MPNKFPLNIHETKLLQEKYGSPLQVYDMNAILDNYNNYVGVFSSKLPNFKQFYAVKALPNPHVIRELVNAGSGLDCSSNTELKLAMKLSVNPKKVMFTSNYTSVTDFKLALN